MIETALPKRVVARSHSVPQRTQLGVVERPSMECWSTQLNANRFPSAVPVAVCFALNNIY